MPPLTHAQLITAPPSPAFPFFDSTTQTAALMAEIQPAMERVIRSQRFILGEEVAAFEREIAGYLGVEHAIGVSSGTDALAIALSALSIGEGDEVITTPYTFFATTGAILRVGATPVFVDIEPDSFNLNAELVAQAVTPRTRAILPVHLFGQMADMQALRAIATRHGLALIEDAAQAIGATLHGKRAGALGDLGCFSFFPTKNLGAFGDGGLVTTNDAQLAELCRSLRGHGFSAKHFSQRLGGNYRLDALQAAILRVKLPYLEGFNARRRKHAEHYSTAASSSFGLPRELEGRTHVYNQFVVRSPERDALASHLLSRGIQCEHYYPFPIHLQPTCARLGYRVGSLPQAEAAAQQSLALPIFPELEDWMVRAVAEALSTFR